MKTTQLGIYLDGDITEAKLQKIKSAIMESVRKSGLHVSIDDYPIEEVQP